MEPTVPEPGTVAHITSSHEKQQGFYPPRREGACLEIKPLKKTFLRARDIEEWNRLLNPQREGRGIWVGGKRSIG